VATLFTALTALLVAAMTLPLVFLLGRRIFNRSLAGLAHFIERLADAVDVLNDRVGRTVSWLVLLMVLMQSVVVIQRYVFGIGSLWMQESVTYMHALLFMLAAGYTLLHGGHVRVDVFYREASPRRKALVDFLGTYLFLFPVAFVILDFAYPSVALSWRVREGSTETSGIPYLYLLKTVILVFAGLVLAQGYSLAVRTAFLLAGVKVDTVEAERSISKI
jgi:TRAP-type mannitol/chloroaromatic compound transport system permease small subunit